MVLKILLKTIDLPGMSVAHYNLFLIQEAAWLWSVFLNSREPCCLSQIILN